MNKKNILACLATALVITACNNDTTDGATTGDSTRINKSDSRRNTDVTTDPIQDTTSTKFDPQKTGGTPTKPNNL